MAAVTSTTAGPRTPSQLRGAGRLRCESTIASAPSSARTSRRTSWIEAPSNRLMSIFQPHLPGCDHSQLTGQFVMCQYSDPRNYP